MSTISIDKAKNLKPLQKANSMVVDRVIDALYSQNGIPDTTLHGGLAIWRCYGSARYSNDVDVYSEAEISKETLRTIFIPHNIEILNYRDTGNVIFVKASSTVGRPDTSVELEIMRKPAEGMIVPYRKTDGSKIEVVAISPEELVAEKISSYVDRGEMRDLYDINHLGTNVIGAKKLDSETRMRIVNLLGIIRHPRDELELRKKVYSEKAPSYEQILLSLSRLSRYY